MSPENTSTLPISTAPTQFTTSDGTAGKPADAPARRRRLVCSSLCAAALVIVAVAVLTLSFTVYKVSEPTMRLNSVNFGPLNLSRNLTVTADVSVKNPNSVGFRFSSCTTSLLYRGKEVGSAGGPPGSVGAHRTWRTNVTVEVVADRLLDDPRFMDDVGRGELGLRACTVVGGRVRILGMFRRHVDLRMDCAVNVSIATQAILYQHCTQHMWF